MTELDPLGRIDITAELLRTKMERTRTSLLQAVAAELIEIKVRKNLSIEGHTATLTPDTFTLLPRIISYATPLIVLILTEDYISTDESRLPKLIPGELMQDLSHIDVATAILADKSDAILLQEDPSGFLLLDRGIGRLVASRINESMRSEWDVLLEEVRQATDHYKKFYLIGARTGLGPMPTSIPEGENSNNSDFMR